MAKPKRSKDKRKKSRGKKAAAKSTAAKKELKPARRTEKTAEVASSDGAVPASDAVRNEWARRVEAEYRSAAITQHLTLWLIQMGASPDLIHDGLRIVSDELAHAEMSHHAFLAAGGRQMPAIARESLGLRLGKGEPLEAGVTRYGVEVFCLGETVAVPLFKVLREACVVPTARACLDRVLKDEVRHRDFGWMLLEYLVDMPCEPLVRKLVEHELPGMFGRLWGSYAPVGGEHKKVIPDNDRAWGLMPIAKYRDMLERTLERDYRPRFKRLGFDADSAWEAAVAQRKAG